MRDGTGHTWPGSNERRARHCAHGSGRAGFGISTALGPVVIEIGGNDHGRYNLWFRFGDWF